MTVLVSDCSVAVAWYFEDAASPALDARLDRVRANGAVVLTAWTTEITNMPVQVARQDVPELPHESVNC